MLFRRGVEEQPRLGRFGHGEPVDVLLPGEAAVRAEQGRPEAAVPVDSRGFARAEREERGRQEGRPLRPEAIGGRVGQADLRRILAQAPAERGVAIGPGPPPFLLVRRPGALQDLEILLVDGPDLVPPEITVGGDVRKDVGFVQPRAGPAGVGAARFLGPARPDMLEDQDAAARRRSTAAIAASMADSTVMALVSRRRASSASTRGASARPMSRSSRARMSSSTSS
jgi:hypothetical protein